MKKRVLIGYVPYGSGSRSIAQYVKNYFDDKNKYEICIINIADYTENNIFSKIFNKTGKPSFLQNAFYGLSNNKAFSLGNEKLIIKHLNNTKIREFIKDFNPNIFICTHFSVSYLATFYKKEGIINSKIMTILSDVKFHENSVINHYDVDYFIVQNDIIKNELIKHKVDAKKIYSYGLPINVNFFMKLDDKDFTLKKYSLSGKRPIYLMFAGGTKGYDYIFDYFKNVVKENFPIDIILMTGKNKDLKLKCENLIINSNIKNVIVLGFTKDIYNILNIADVVITKPGSSTLNECTLMKKPCILIPGVNAHEKYNARIMVKKHYALKARNSKVLVSKIRLCLNYPFIVNSMKNRLNKNYVVNDSVKKIYELVSDSLEKK